MSQCRDYCAVCRRTILYCLCADGPSEYIILYPDVAVVDVRKVGTPRPPRSDAYNKDSSDP